MMRKAFPKTKLFMVVFVFFFSLPAFSKNIAVLPFQNLTQDADKNWIGAGFSETLTTKLWNVKSINMVERQQLTKILDELKFQMAGYVDEATAVQVGKMYGVDVMVLGSYQLMENTLRISARFVDVETGKIIKTAEATGNLKDVFHLQDEIAFQLMNTINIALGEKEKQEIKINPTENLTAYNWYGKGYEAHTLKDYDKAIDYYTKAIELDIYFADAYNNRGFAYDNKGNYDEAIQDYNKAIELNPKLAVAYYNRGNAYYYKGDYEQAIEDYDKAIELDPKYADAYLNRGTVYAHKGNYDEAIQDYNKAIELNPKYADAYNNRGNAYAHKGNYDEAIQDYNKAIELNPKDADAYNNRGTAYEKKGLYEKAIENYTKAIMINPEYAYAYNNRGFAYGYKGFYDEAIKDSSRAIEINPKYAKAYFSRGIAYHAKKQYKNCVSDWKKAADLGYGLARKALKKFFNIDY